MILFVTIIFELLTFSFSSLKDPYKYNAKYRSAKKYGKAPQKP